ncbi:hypothetical protein SESBI_46325 [Sesbania bispinosa]|nr:hypothetical protein SESBI_46325 [Sesbania bispinosa]
MAAALECWSRRNSSDEDMVEQVLMEGPTSQPKDPSLLHKKLHKLTRNVSEAIASLKNSLNNLNLNLDSSKPDTCRSSNLVWGTVVRNLTQLYPGSQLPEKLMSNIRKHYDSLPLRCVSSHQADGAALEDEQAAILIQEESDGEMQLQGSLFKLTFACNSPISWPAMSGALDSSSICCKKIQIFEKKGFTLGIVLLLVLSGAGQDKPVRTRVESALKFAMKKPKSSAVKLPLDFVDVKRRTPREEKLVRLKKMVAMRIMEMGFGI